MPSRPELRVNITRQGEKEQALRAFVQRYTTQIDATINARSRELQIVARSMESPVVQAVAGLGEELADKGYKVRMILAQLDAESKPASWSHDGRTVAFAHEVRWARHPRLIEAHEQLVLGPETCWIGDCMRRDPLKSDAFENYIEDCGEAAGCAAVSFERLWVASEPLTALAASGIETLASATDSQSAAYARH
jgi:hypothetical protein